MTNFKITWRDSRFFSKPGLFIRLGEVWYHVFNPNTIKDFFSKLMKE